MSAVNFINLLLKVGITIGKGNKLELDEDALKKANISTLKSLLMGACVIILTQSRTRINRGL